MFLLSFTSTLFLLDSQSYVEGNGSIPQATIKNGNFSVCFRNFFLHLISFGLPKHILSYNKSQATISVLVLLVSD